MERMMGEKPRWFAIKAEVRDPQARALHFTAHRTMYGGKDVAVGDTVFVFASENEGGDGLAVRGTVAVCERVPRTEARRQTPRVSLTIAGDGAVAALPLGRTELKAFRSRSMGVPQAELDFKLYRQATDKLVGLTDPAGEFLDRLFCRS